MTQSLRLRLTDLKELGAVLEELRAFTAACDVPLQIQRDLHLAVDEIVTNIFRHGYGEALGAGRIDLSLSVAKERVEVEIRDTAPAFNPLERQPPDISLPPEKREVGGLGVYFVRQLMDRVDYERTGGENRITLRREIRT